MVNASLVYETSRARLRDHQLGLGVQISTPQDLSFLFLTLIVEHVVHLVVDHIVSELLTVGTRKLLAQLATKGSANLTRALHQFVMLTGGEDGARAVRLEGTPISSRPRPKLRVHQFLLIYVC